MPEDVCSVILSSNVYISIWEPPTVTPWDCSNNSHHPPWSKFLFCVVEPSGSRLLEFMRNLQFTNHLYEAVTRVLSDLVWLLRKIHGQNDLRSPWAVHATVRGMLHAGDEQIQTKDTLTGIKVPAGGTYRNRSLYTKRLKKWKWNNTALNQRPHVDRMIHLAHVRHTAALSRAQNLSLIDSRRVSKLGRNTSQDLGGPPALNPQRGGRESEVQKESSGYLGVHLVTPYPGAVLSTCCVLTTRNRHKPTERQLLPWPES